MDEILNAVKTCLRKYATFEGRAGRPEYWWFVLAYVVASVVIGMVSNMLSGLLGLGVLVPSIAAAARRLHDTGKSGWMQLIALIPVIGWVLVIYWLAQPTVAANQYGDGPDPLPKADPVPATPGA
jgi:uncharacterized membrane protein YhaH (DUF805 family)